MIWIKLASIGHLGLISDPLIVSKLHNETNDPKGHEKKFEFVFYRSNDMQDGRKMANAYQCPQLNHF